MSRAKPSRAQRRLMKLLDRITSADCRFFNERHRQYRVRLATEPEIEQLELVEGPLDMKFGHRMIAVIKQVSFDTIVTPEYTPEVEESLRIIAEMMSSVSSTVPVSQTFACLPEASGPLVGVRAVCAWAVQTGARETVVIDWSTFPPISGSEGGPP